MQCGTDLCNKTAEYRAGYDGEPVAHAIGFCDDHLMIELSAHYAGMLDGHGRVWIEPIDAEGNVIDNETQSDPA